jgi:hypothetical protein
MIMSIPQNYGICEKFIRFGLKVAGHAFSFTLVMVLIGAWIITGPIFKLTYQITRIAKQIVGRKRTEGRPEYKWAARRMIMAKARNGSAIHLPA